MAPRGVSWAPDAHVRFRDLDFLIDEEGELKLAAPLSPTSADVDLDDLVESLVNITIQFSGEEPPSEEEHMRGLVFPFPFRLRGGSQLHGDLLVCPMLLSHPVQFLTGRDRDDYRPTPHSADGELVGVVEYTLASTSDDDNLQCKESFHNDASSTGSTHPSRVCFMADDDDGHESERRNASPSPRPEPRPGGNAREAGAATPPPRSSPAGLHQAGTLAQTPANSQGTSHHAPVAQRDVLAQLCAWQQELEQNRRELERQQADLLGELERTRAEETRACARARDIRRRIMEDDDGLPHFEWASQNIAAAATIL